MSEVAGFIPAKTFLQYQSPLLRVSAGNAARLLEYQSSLLRLWADAAPGPWFQYQRSLLRFWAGAYELVARNYENALASFNTVEGMPRPNSIVSGSSQDNKPIIDQMSDLAAESLAETKTVAADQPKTVATKQKIAGANARKKIVKKASKAIAKTGRK
jgi:hypothetical protein